jgi:hypothetical protein
VGVSVNAPADVTVYVPDPGPGSPDGGTMVLLKFTLPVVVV